MNRAFLYALKVHDGQKRKDGKPYIVHPFAVANILTENGAEKDLVCAGLLHDVIEDGGVTAEELQKEFGRKVVRLILFDTEDKTLSWERRKSALLAALKDCGRNCAMLVCADKLANLQDISEALQGRQRKAGLALRRISQSSVPSVGSENVCRTERNCGNGIFVNL